MAEAARLHGLLHASAARNAYNNKALVHDLSSYVPTHKLTKVAPLPQRTPGSLLVALITVSKNGLPEAQPDAHLSAEVKDGVNKILRLLDASIARKDPAIISAVPVQEIPLDTANDLAIENCKRLLTVRSNSDELKIIADSLGISVDLLAMAGRFPVLSTSNLPQATPEEQSATASPARGTAMLNSIFKSVRVPEFRHKWMFWAEKGQQASGKDKSAQSEEYASRPKPLGEQIISVKEFYQHFNNIPVESLKLRDSIHLFHLGIKPVWEDPRNTRGGAWYFKIPKDIAAQFWHEMCLLAVGDGLQGAVETKRACKSFLDHIVLVHTDLSLSLQR